jgi:CRISPR-associated endoribonuclease Cas6
MMPSRASCPVLVGSLCLHLRACEETRFNAYPARSLHAALHRKIEAVDPALGRSVHEATDKPFALSPLYRRGSDEPVEGVVATGERLWAQLTALESGVLAALWTLLGPLPILDLEHRAFQIEAVAPSAPAGTSHPLITYPSLYAAEAPTAQITLRFSAPTAFRNMGRDFLRPEPRLVFYSYLRRWERFSGTPLPGVDKDSLGRSVVLLEAEAQERCISFGAFEQPAFVGWASYRVLGGEMFQRGVATLARYAAYCGTGARTALGMGQTERVR